MLENGVQLQGLCSKKQWALFEESDIKLSSTRDSLLVQSTNFPVEVCTFVMMIIPQAVATGVSRL